MNLERPYLGDQAFEKIQGREGLPARGEYERCSFAQCDFSEADLSDSRFVDCVFSGCNLSLVKVAHTALQDVRFSGSKLVGVSFELCRAFGLSVGFDGCILDHSSFAGLRLKKTAFRTCQLHEVDFTGCDLTESVFDRCDLLRAVFRGTLLEQADFRSAVNYSIDPEANRLRKARFSLSGVAGLLDKYGVEILGG
jgi:fluoroquinolone resistance protein